MGTDFCASVARAVWLCLFLQEMLRCWWAKQAASLLLVPLWTAGYVNEASCPFVTKGLVQAL